MPPFYKYSLSLTGSSHVVVLSGILVSIEICANILSGAAPCQCSTSGGIFIPDSAKEKPQKGEVIAVGLGKLNEKGEREPMDVKVGDTVLYAKYAGTDIKMDGVEYKILSIKDALAIIE